MADDRWFFNCQPSIRLRQDHLGVVSRIEQDDKYRNECRDGQDKG